MSKHSFEKSSLDKLASQLALQASGEIPFLDKLEAFKALTTYYVNTTKVKDKNPETTNNKETFDGYRERVTAATGGSGSRITASRVNGDIEAAD